MGPHQSDSFPKRHRRPQRGEKADNRKRQLSTGHNRDHHVGRNQLVDDNVGQFRWLNATSNLDNRQYGCKSGLKQDRQEQRQADGCKHSPDTWKDNGGRRRLLLRQSIARRGLVYRMFIFVNGTCPFLSFHGPKVLRRRYRPGAKRATIFVKDCLCCSNQSDRKVF